MGSSLMPALVAEHVSKTYSGARGTIHAVDDLRLEVEKGRLFAFLGRNGAGKTTFIKIASTLLLPTSGSIRLFGLDVVAEPRAVREQIAVVPQEGHPFDHLTPREHVREYLRIRGTSAETARTRTEEMLTAMGLQSYADEPAIRLSGGLRQRTLVAMILATEAPFLFLDEPTLGLDPFARRQVWEVVRRVARKGSTVFLTTHYLDEAEQLSEELAVIESGRILYRGNAEALKSTVRREVRLRFVGPVTAEDLRPFGDVSADREGLTLLTTRSRVAELTQLALERNAVIAVGPVTLEEAFLALVGKRIEEDSEEWES
jgi:ABC-2 type transport system ATP-binding protein